MKYLHKILTISILTMLTTSAMAHGHHGHWRSVHSGGGWNWVAPVIIGGVIGYEISRPPVVVQQPPVVIQQPPAVVQGQNCSPWTQIQNPDGSITTTRTCQ